MQLQLVALHLQEMRGVVNGAKPCVYRVVRYGYGAVICTIRRI